MSPIHGAQPFAFLVDWEGMNSAGRDVAPLSQVSWDEAAGVVRVVWDAGAIVGEVEARQVTDAIEALGRGAVPLLVDMRLMKKLDRGAREHFKVNKAGVTRVALLIDSPVTKMLANFFMSTDAGNTPTRMFTQESTALDWLREQN